MDSPTELSTPPANRALYSASGNGTWWGEIIHTPKRRST